jgi:hypothetical protein
MQPHDRAVTREAAMIIDWYSKLVLTVIATCLVVIAFKPLDWTTSAQAQSEQRVRVMNTNEIALCIYEVQRAQGVMNQVHPRWCRSE